jgi:hypothetical protein
MRADLADGPPGSESGVVTYVLCAADPQAGGGHVALYAVGRRVLKIK